MRCLSPVDLSRTTAKSGIIGRNKKSTLPVRYVLMAKKSQTSGERKFGQIMRSLGYGNSQNASHGRPRWMSGNIAPIINANTVITSAHRVTGRRHPAFTRRRIAEISVPA
jgi:hypothetical protein